MTDNPHNHDPVVLASNTNIEYEIGFNFLEVPVENPDPESQAFDNAVSALAANFETLLAQSNHDSSWGARMSGVTRAVVRGLAEYQVRADETVTMLDMALLLADEENRQRIRQKMSEERIEWIQQASHVVSEYTQDDLEPLFQRLWEWIIPRAVRSAVSHPSTSVSIDDIIREGKTLVVEHAALADAEKQLIIAALLRRAWMAVQEQTHCDDQSNPPQFSFVCRTEYGRINHGLDMTEIRCESRKYGFSTFFGCSTSEDDTFPEDVAAAVGDDSLPFLALYPQDDYANDGPLSTDLLAPEKDDRQGVPSDVPRFNPNDTGEGES